MGCRPAAQTFAMSPKGNAASTTTPARLHDQNPHPCGYAGDPKRICRCSYDQVQRYRGRLSGPVIDRFDLHVLLPPVPVAALREAASGESSERVRKRVERARATARARNSEATARKEEATLSEPARQILHRSMDVLGLSLRAYIKVLRVARTLADLEGHTAISTSHIAEAIQYRQLDRDPRSHDAGRPAAISVRR